MLIERLINRYEYEYAKNLTAISMFTGALPPPNVAAEPNTNAGNVANPLYAAERVREAGDDTATGAQGHC